MTCYSVTLHTEMSCNLVKRHYVYARHGVDSLPPSPHRIEPCTGRFPHFAIPSVSDVVKSSTVGEPMSAATPDASTLLAAQMLPPVPEGDEEVPEHETDQQAVLRLYDALVEEIARETETRETLQRLYESIADQIKYEGGPIPWSLMLTESWPEARAAPVKWFAQTLGEEVRQGAMDMDAAARSMVTIVADLSDGGRGVEHSILENHYLRAVRSCEAPGEAVSRLTPETQAMMQAARRRAGVTEEAGTAAGRVQATGAGSARATAAGRVQATAAGRVQATAAGNAQWSWDDRTWSMRDWGVPSAVYDVMLNMGYRQWTAGECTMGWAMMRFVGTVGAVIPMRVEGFVTSSMPTIFDATPVIPDHRCCVAERARRGENFNFQMPHAYNGNWPHLEGNTVRVSMDTTFMEADVVRALAVAVHLEVEVVVSVSLIGFQPAAVPQCVLPHGVIVTRDNARGHLRSDREPDLLLSDDATNDVVVDVHRSLARATAKVQTSLNQVIAPNTISVAVLAKMAPIIFRVDPATMGGDATAWPQATRGVHPNTVQMWEDFGLMQPESSRWWQDIREGRLADQSSP